MGGILQFLANSNAQGSGRVAVSYTIAANATNLDVFVDSIPGYILGKSDITVTVNTGVYVWSQVQGVKALRIIRTSTGDTVKLVNNGYIVGWGGNGAGLQDYGEFYCYCAGGPSYAAYLTTPSDGTVALEYQSFYGTVPLTIENNGYIAGGGGGGGGAIDDDPFISPGMLLGGAFGGGGAGGGVSYSDPGIASSRVRATPTSPTGLNGTILPKEFNGGTINFYRGGGGGFIFPGVGGSITYAPSGIGTTGRGGGSGGSGAITNNAGSGVTPSNGGGTGNGEAENIDNAAAYYQDIGGGGGGWGARGASGVRYLSKYQQYAFGGPAINRFGDTVTVSTGSNRIYGAIV